MRSIAIIFLCLLPAALIAGDDNPFKKSKVGDWVEHKMRGSTFEGKTKMTVTSKTDKEVTLDIESTVSFGRKETKSPVQKQTVDLSKDYDAISAANLKSNNTKIETIGEGMEKVKVGGKEFDTKWKKLKSTTIVNDMMIVSEYKMWFSKDVPLNGLVKMETRVGTFLTTVEFTGSGSK